MTNTIKDQVEKWKYVFAFVMLGSCAALLSFGATAWVYRDIMDRQASNYQDHIKALNDQLALERGETRQLLAQVLSQLVTVGGQLTEVADLVRGIAEDATKVSTDAADTAKEAAKTAKSAAASVRRAVKELKADNPSPKAKAPAKSEPKPRRQPKEHIEP